MKLPLQEFYHIQIPFFSRNKIFLLPRLILELKDKIKKSFNVSDSADLAEVTGVDVTAGSEFEQAIEAMMALGYNRAEAMGALEKVKSKAKTTEEYIRKALGQLI